jgi:hypothetical protein
MSRQRSQQPLCCLSQSETCPQIYRQRRNDQSSNEAPVDRSGALPSFYQCPEQHDQEHRERKHLERKTRQQDVVRCRWVPLVGVGNPDQSSSRDLNECRRDVANDEDPEDKLRRHWCIFSSIDADHDGDERVDGRGEEDRCDNDEEVLSTSVYANTVEARYSYLDHKPRHRVRILLAREYAKGVTNNLHRSPHDHGAKVPCAMAQEQNEMG